MRKTSDEHLFRRMEAEKIYKAIFQQSPPAEVTGRFIPASERLDQAVDAEELTRYRGILANCADLEAAEIATRYLRRSDLLTRKFRLMAYLAETAPENQHFFINERSSFLIGFWQSALGTLHTVFALVKGVWLLRRCDHA
jgi:hypothetical protein